MTSQTERYLLGMRAVNNFFVMLHQALREALPTAQISENGAYGWRGYQINRYEDLATNQYYCQIYPSNTKETCVLVFQESFKDPYHKPIDEYEQELRIWTGVYCYPFRVSLDLYRVRFFYLDVYEQYVLLKNFVNYAAQQALIWQCSKFRNQNTNPRFLMGSDVHHKQKKTKMRDMKQVDIEFMDVWKTQHDIFQRLKNMLSFYLPHIPRNEKDWIRANASPHHFDFRGYFLRSGKLLPKEFDIRWQIFYEKPEILSCLTSKKERIDEYNLVNHHYFDLPSEQQDCELTGFIKNCLDRF